jgi:hypothetical protein
MCWPCASSASFDNVVAKTNDPAFATPTAGAALVAATVPLEDAPAAAPVSDAQLAPIVAEAKRRWLSSGLLTLAQQAELLHASVAVGELGGILLGTAAAGKVTLDVDGAGHGWFVDVSPSRDEEFRADGDELASRPDGHAAGRIDLLTVVMHELGHAVGLEHAAGGDGVMVEALGVGVRRPPAGVASAERPAASDAVAAPERGNDQPAAGATISPGRITSPHGARLVSGVAPAIRAGRPASARAKATKPDRRLHRRLR